MALTFQGFKKSAIRWGLCTNASVRPVGSGTFTSIGAVRNVNVAMEPVGKPGDPSGSLQVQYLHYTVQFDMLQTDAASAELAMLAGTSGTGLYETDIEIKFTFASGRTLTLGAASGYTCRMVPGWSAGSDDDAEFLPVTVESFEPITGFNTKVG